MRYYNNIDFTMLFWATKQRIHQLLKSLLNDCVNDKKINVNKVKDIYVKAVGEIYALDRKDGYGRLFQASNFNGTTFENFFVAVQRLGANNLRRLGEIDFFYLSKMQQDVNCLAEYDICVLSCIIKQFIIDAHMNNEKAFDLSLAKRVVLNVVRRKFENDLEKKGIKLDASLLTFNFVIPIALSAQEFFCGFDQDSLQDYYLLNSQDPLQIQCERLNKEISTSSSDHKALPSEKTDSIIVEHVTNTAAQKKYAVSDEKKSKRTAPEDYKQQLNFISDDLKKNIEEAFKNKQNTKISLLTKELKTIWNKAERSLPSELNDDALERFKRQLATKFIQIVNENIGSYLARNFSRKPLFRDPSGRVVPYKQSERCQSFSLIDLHTLFVKARKEWLIVKQQLFAKIDDRDTKVLEGYDKKLSELEANTIGQCAQDYSRKLFKELVKFTFFNIILFVFSSDFREARSNAKKVILELDKISSPGVEQKFQCTAELATNIDGINKKMKNAGKIIFKGGHSAFFYSLWNRSTQSKSEHYEEAKDSLSTMFSPTQLKH